MIEKITSEAVLGFYDYYEILKGTALMPKRSQLDPVKMPVRLLPYILIYMIEENPRRYKVRLAGTHICELFDQETTGWYLDELDVGDYKPTLLNACDRVVESKKADFLTSNYFKSDGRHLSFERICAPFADETGQNVSHLVVCLHIKDITEHMR